MVEYKKGDDIPLHVENIIADTKDGAITFTMDKGTGKYKVDIIPIEEK